MMPDQAVISTSRALTYVNDRLTDPALSLVVKFAYQLIRLFRGSVSGGH
jgi:hypothetical protein